MTNRRLFRCGACGGDVLTKLGPGRTYELRRGLSLPVPEDFGIPTCTECGEEYLTVELADSLAERLRLEGGE